jgi:hypothetical protein
VDKVSTQLPANRLTVVNGILRSIFWWAKPIQNVTGFTCAAGANQGWWPDGCGAGWFIVQNWQNTAGLANPCYMFDNKRTSDYSCSGLYDPNWDVPSTHDWFFGHQSGLDSDSRNASQFFIDRLLSISGVRRYLQRISRGPTQSGSNPK